MIVEKWHQVGFHPTPIAVVESFVAFVTNATAPSKKSINVLDACSGDGRLGRAVADRLVELGYLVHVTFVEVDYLVSRSISRSPKWTSDIINDDFFSFSSQKKFDIIVSNPPYEKIGVADTVAYGLDWIEVNASGRNLYGLALRKCLGLCAERGLVAVIAPHGWLRNVNFSELRTFAFSLCEEIRIKAFSSRNLFPSVSQDTSFQLLLRSGGGEKVRATIAYDEGAPRALRLSDQVNREKVEGVSIKVGPLVWNRMRESLRRYPRGSLLIINGGNISSNGRLLTNIRRYRDRQFVLLKDIPVGFISSGPFIAIKRTLRGQPGEWKVDYVVVNSRSFRCVAENHVIVVKMPRSATAKQVRDYARTLADLVEHEHADHGHPSVSVQLVRHAARKINESVDSIIISKAVKDFLASISTKGRGTKHP